MNKIFRFILSMLASYAVCQWPAENLRNISDLVDAVRNNPNDSTPRDRLHADVLRAKWAYDAEANTFAKPLSGGEREEIMMNTYRLLLDKSRADLSARLFSDALKDYRSGRYLIAFNRMAFITRLGTGPDWIISEAGRYMTAEIPAAMEAKINTKEKPLRTPYSRVWHGLKSEQWKDVPLYAESYEEQVERTLAPKRWESEIKDVEELHELASLIDARIHFSRLPSWMVRRRLAEGIVMINDAPAQAMNLLEPLLYQPRGLTKVELGQVRTAMSLAYAAMAKNTEKTEQN